MKITAAAISTADTDMKSLVAGMTGAFGNDTDGTALPPKGMNRRHNGIIQ